ncbi:dihydroxyacetone kinase family protein [Curtobacterium sp. Csp1]|uniref:Dihydroxyacetone kinase family protein n=1 Tax=Curtobacterium citreum TaxID=2036 RepID=A0ABT2HI35_9MICO|nr:MULTISPECIES: dihydroxyacetone kinase family protein [Curtobacterium]KTR03114.1 dihydroxyacetone kinase [Curtobacterium citreum]MCS6522936.1 dihydroxyacetone kinase family protein [Curtobacterium citreum]QKS13609.1 dihydroxyacetone kinase family protein [Curtobacterium sp. csp3]QKS15839.1 dihydroxyacetone kinase family protein [Curtobacterium sp. Csp2]QKS20650.1 dihydroxyacetone kinase family protein [Curtobacterium sp. Csp1]
MTTIHDDPEDFAEDQLAGWLALYADRVRGVHGGVVALPTEGAERQVAVVVGGGSGHYPAFCGVVGPGFATGAVVGNVFTSPSAAQVYSVAKAADQGRGVVLSFGNYAGDTMNFGLAAERLRAEGIDTRIVVVTDDVASADEVTKRRGIAGDFSVFKAMGAAAAAGAELDEVERVGTAANAATRTIGVAFSGCTMPGATEPLFSVPDRHLGLGLGIHGEPGIQDVPVLPARDLAALLVERLLAERPEGAGPRVAPILNGLGDTKYEELFLLWGRVLPLLEDAGLEVVEPEVGELVTSLDMGGCSLTLQFLDDELERYWRADAYTPAYRKVAAPVAALVPAAAVTEAAAEATVVPEATGASRRAAETARVAVEAMDVLLREQEETLGRIDAVAGDGDHGRGMVKGIGAARRAVEQTDREAGVAFVLGRAGEAWAASAGGTSGVLWGAALEAFGRALGDDAEHVDAADVVAAAQAFADSIVHLGGASRGDKTLLDALMPFVDELRSRVDEGADTAEAWQAAAGVAVEQAAATADLRPRVGRARPLAEKSVGTPDAGATSMGMVLTRIGEVLAVRARREGVDA